MLARHTVQTFVEALVLNFVSGLLVLSGGIIVLYLLLTWDMIGLISAVLAGVYMQIAGSKCIPQVDRAAETITDRLIFLSYYALGTIPIGLVFSILLVIKFCECDIRFVK